MTMARRILSSITIKTEVQKESEDEEDITDTKNVNEKRPYECSRCNKAFKRRAHLMVRKGSYVSLLKYNFSIL